MSNSKKPNKTDAIRMVLDTGQVGDYCDVAAQVKKRFGMTVGEGLIEKIHLSTKRPDTNRQLPDPHIEPGKVKFDKARVLEFVDEMGGFSEAKEAIVELEKTIKRLI